MKIRLTRFDIIHCLVVSVVISFIAPFFMIVVYTSEISPPGETLKVPDYKKMAPDTMSVEDWKEYFESPGAFKEVKGFEKVLYQFEPENRIFIFRMIYKIFVIVMISCLIVTIWNNSKKMLL